MKYTFLTIVFSLLLLIGTLAQIMDWKYAPYVFALGTVLAVMTALLQARLFTENKRLHRLGRIHFLSSLMLCLATYCMFIYSNSWVVFLLIYAVVTLFLTYRLPEK